MSKISQKDYLKKYLMSDEKLKKKKKKSKDKPKKGATVKIIDDDDYGGHGDHELDENDLFATNEEAPQIVGVIDERAPDVIMKQEYVESGKWKKIGEEAKLKADKLRKQQRRSLSDDASPPRRGKSPATRRDGSLDNSPPRKRKNSSDESPPRRSDFRPTRKSRSPARSKRKNSSVDSPPRQSRKRRDSDASPPRRMRKDTPEASHPRQSSYKRSEHNRRDSPPRRSKKSPERSRHQNSPPRRTIKQERNDDDASPPRRNRQRKDSDASPPRRQNNSPGPSRRQEQPQGPSRKEESPLPYQRRSTSRSPQRQRRSRWSPEVKREPVSVQRDSPPRSSKMTKTLDGKVSGLQDAKTLKRENDAHKERQEKMFREMRPELSGRNAEVVIRDRRGRNKDFENEVEDERKKSEFEAARKKEYDRWGKGLKQIEDLEKRYEEHMHEASKPLARMADDADLRDHLREQERMDDPMLMYMRKKKQEESKKKGVEVKPKYKGQFPDNRYNIAPGYRWDGVDRSNGYEKKYFSMINSKKSMEEEAYRYATEDM